MSYSSAFLVVQTSLWPFFCCLSFFSFFSNFLLYVNQFVSVFSALYSFLGLILVAFVWWKDFLRESLIGYHTHKLEVSLRVGVLLFILSEVFFFVSFFWAFYDSSLSPVVELGMQWPPNGVVPLSAYSVPLLNTIILLSSGVTVTWAHHSLINNFFSKSVASLAVTVVLGVYFLYMQVLEYSEAQFSMADGVYGSVFFMATGFHGFHVFIGASFLLWNLVLLSWAILTSDHHFCFEAAAWYWHFVDVVWLILFVSIYVWGGL